MNRIDELRTKWKTATPEERKVIEEEARLLKGNTTYQCYFEKNGVRCKNYQQDCWCSDEHRIAWQGSNYIDTRKRGEHRLSVQEIQSRLRDMGRQKLL